MLSPQHRERKKHEQVCKIIARYMALSIPPGMGAEIPVPNNARAGRERSVQVCNGVLPAIWLRSNGTECTSGSCAFAGEGSAELGQSLLGQRVLRGYGRAEQRDDTKIREVPREGRNASATASIESRE